MHKRFGDAKPAAQWASLVALMSILLFAAAADGLMDTLGPGGFLVAGVMVMVLAWVLVEEGQP